MSVLGGLALPRGATASDVQQAVDARAAARRAGLPRPVVPARIRQLSSSPQAIVAGSR